MKTKAKPVLPLPSTAITWRVIVPHRIRRKTPQTRGLYVEMRVFASHRELLAHLKLEAEASNVSGPIDPRTVGLMQTPLFDHPRRWYVGTVSFSQDYLTPDVIVHELAHAAFAVAARQELVINLQARDDSWKAEDTYCYILDHLVTEFLDGAAFRGLYPPKTK